jgi:hypothetical protein
MSHVAALSMQVKSLSALKKAALACGLELVEGQTTYRWYGRWVQDYHGENAAYKLGIDPKNYGKCDHAIRIPGNAKAYEIGVVKSPNGEGYELVWDFWQGGYGLEAKIGSDGEKLRKEYVKAVTQETAINEMNCSDVQIEEQKDGSVVMYCYEY